MKKYNRSEIMKRAWALVKGMAMSIFEGLKKAWKEAKEVKKVFTGFAKVEVVDTMSTGEAAFYTFKMWEKNDKKRIYVNDYKRRTIGYIDLNNENEIITEYCGNQLATIEKFVAEYAF